ncbi:MAG: glycosyltransferase family 2 protein [bacterium]|nr:glycosyltransferase family 2 protein [bacterium]
MKITLLAPTLNEIEAVQVVLPKIKKEWVDEILVIDGGSTDGTIEYCQNNGYSVYKQKGRGYGQGMKEGMNVAQGDIIIEFPPDGNSPPERILDLISKINEGYDFVIASRYLKGARSYDDDFLTSKGNRIFTFLVNLLFRSNYSDVLIGFRAYRKDAFSKLKMNASGLDWSIQMPIQFAKNKLKVAEIPVDEPKRIGGERKMLPFRTGWKILTLLIKEFLNK